ncbi:MAG: hypothetical protein M3N47_11970 [Chloroflexota bacterium]|nr:hypothetical protein [Chloroflexota bacterium]
MGGGASSQIAFAWIALATFLAVAVAAVAVPFGAGRAIAGAAAFLVAAAGYTAFYIWLTIVGSWSRLRARLRSRRQGLGERDSRTIALEAQIDLRDRLPNANGPFFFVIGWSAVIGCSVMLSGPDGPAPWDVLFTGLVLVAYVLAASALRVGVAYAALSRPEQTDDDRERAWRAENPWRAAFVDAAPLPLAIEALILVHSGPGGLRIALALLVAAIAALAVAAVRLERGRQEMDVYSVRTRGQHKSGAGLGAHRARRALPRA